MVINLVEELKTVEEQVRYLLKEYPDTTNNDLYLTILYLKYIAKLPIGYVSYEDIKGLSGRIETIRRIRQHIQNDDGDLLPTNLEIREARFNRSQAMRQAVKRLKEEKHGA